MAITFFPGGIARTFSQGIDAVADATQCVTESGKADPDLVISHCDRALRARDQLPLDLLVATLNGRAWAYMQKDDYYRAIADFGSAHKINYQSPAAFHERNLFVSANALNRA